MKDLSGIKVKLVEYYMGCNDVGKGLDTWPGNFSRHCITPYALHYLPNAIQRLLFVGTSL